jgi:Tfp pilus assembly PilM family ATPase
LSHIKDITSTEKLLDIIRNKKNGASLGPLSASAVDKKKGRFQFASPRIVPLRKSANVGVDIGHEFLRMVKAERANDNKWELLDCKSVPLTHIASRESQEFINFLRSELILFCGSDMNVNLWVNMSAARVNVRHITIPKVPKKQIENAVYWTIKKETPFDEKDTVFDFEIQGEVNDQGVSKWLTMVYTASKEDIEDKKRLFSRMGLPLAGISITPFAIQNIFKTGWIPSAVEGTIASLFIGNNFSRIDIYSKGKLIMTRGIKAGVNSMVESLTERLSGTRQEKSGAGRKRIPLSVEQVRKILFSLSPDSPQLSGEDIGIELNDEDKFEAITPALERIVRQTERTFEHLRTNLKYDKVDKIYISSAVNISRLIVEYIGEQLDMQRDLLDPLHLKMPHTSMGDISMSERLAFTPALGLAISDNAYTPNLIFRFKEKERASVITKVNRIILAVFIALIFISSGIFFIQIQESRHKKETIAGLEKQLAQHTPRIDQNEVSRIVAHYRNGFQMAKEYSDRYLGLAIISEISSLTPPNVRLLSLKTNLGAPPTGKEPAKETKNAEVKNVILEGVIIGDRRTLESSLAGYIMKLEASPMFHRISIKKNSIEPFKKNEALHFIIDLKIGE